MITVNFFTNWIKEINITKYGSDKQLVSTSSPDEIYQYSDKIHLKNRKNITFQLKKDVRYRGNINRRIHNSNTAADITDENIEHRINKFADVIILMKFIKSL